MPIQASTRKYNEGEQNAALVEEASAASTSLQEQAQTLSGLVSQFSLPENLSLSGTRVEQERPSLTRVLPAVVRPATVPDDIEVWKNFQYFNQMSKF